jgi:Mor family transcriptional regulator
MAGDVLLYDTPFLETPQTNLVSEKTDRNAEIITLYKMGKTTVSIARQFHLSGQRVNQIIRGRRN